jgi:hypothetical protein
LLEHISKGDLQPEAIISHRMPLSDAARGYEVFEKKQSRAHARSGWRSFRLRRACARLRLQVLTQGANSDEIPHRSTK